MREAVRINIARLPNSVDVVLHPRKSVIDMDFENLAVEIARIFSTVSTHIDRNIGKKDGAGQTSAGPGSGASRSAGPSAEPLMAKKPSVRVGGQR